MIDPEALTLSTLIAGLVGVVTIMLSAIVYLTRKQREQDEDEEIDIIMSDVEDNAEEKIGKKNNKNQRKNNQWKAKTKDVNIDHPWYISTLKGHTNDVTDIDFASDDKKFLSISNDRNVILWDVRDFDEKEHKSIRQTLDFDTPTRISFAPDCKSVLFSVKRENKICVYKLTKKTEGTSYHFVHIDAIDFKKRHLADILSIGIDRNAKYLMSSSHDNKVILYDLKGNVLKSIDPKVSSLYDCRISPDGKFVIIAGFTPDVFVYEPTFNRDGSFQDVKKVFNLSGHDSGVLAAGFNATSTRAVTVSKDGHWRVFDTDIRYDAGQDAKILRKGYWNRLKGSTYDNVKLGISPSGNSFAISVGSSIKFVSSDDSDTDFQDLDNVHTSRIMAIKFSPDGRYITTCGDKYIRVFKNVPELYSRISKLKKELMETTQEGARRRITSQIEEDQKEIEQFD